MKKNYQIHIVVEKDLYEFIKEEASKNGVSMGDICRLKLREYTKLTKIEIMLENIQRKLKSA